MLASPKNPRAECIAQVEWRNRERPIKFSAVTPLTLISNTDTFGTSEHNILIIHLNCLILSEDVIFSSCGEGPVQFSPDDIIRQFDDQSPPHF